MILYLIIRSPINIILTTLPALSDSLPFLSFFLSVQKESFITLTSEMTLLLTARSCGAYLYDMNEREKLLNDSTTINIFRTPDNSCHFLCLIDTNHNLYFFPIIRTSVTVKIAEFLYIICHGERYLGIAFPMFGISFFFSIFFP